VTDVSAKELEFLSNETIEGGSLAERLAKGGLPAEEALRYAIDLGTALNQAHRRGVVHGKLSPHAVLLTDAGARITRPMEGTDLDALPYRSPEQVLGEAPDWRSDIFAFGTLLYEMVSGRRAFSGEGAALDRAILERPPATLLGKSPIHAAMEGVIAGCIEKDPGRRRQRVQNAVIELKLAGRSLSRLAELQPRAAKESSLPPAAAGLTGETDIRPKRPRIFAPVEFPDEIQAVRGNEGRRRLMMWLFFVLALAFIGAGLWVAMQYLHPRPAPVYNFPVVPPENATYRMPAVSPDGRYVVIQLAGPEGKPMLWLRALDAMKATRITGTEGGFAPFWSPDSQYIAFFADNALKKIRINGDPAVKICDAEALPGGGTWNRAGTIVFAPGQGSTLYQVPAAGGKPQPVFKLNAEKFEHAHLWPQFLPDGKHFVFFVLSDSAAATGVYVGALDSPDYRLLFSSETNAVYSSAGSADSAENGYLLYIRNRSLIGQGFNLGRLELHGEPITLQDDVGQVQSLSLAPISVSENAVLVYQSVGAATRQLSWLDRSGRTIVPVTTVGDWGPPRIAPDGTRAVVAKLGPEKKNADLWIVDQAGNATQFTSGPSHKGSPVWSPDGSRIAYFSNLEGSYDIFLSPVNNGAKVDLLYKSAQAKYPTDWSRDGKYLLFGILTQGSASDVWALSMADRRAGPILDTIYSEGYAAMSPDGKWLAFQTDESGRNQVYVQPFDGITRGTKRRYDISTETGGGLPRWSGDGKELFFMTNTGRMMSAKVHPDGEEFGFDPPQTIFQTRPIPNSWNLYDVSADGQRFLMNLPMEWSSPSPITVMTNWTEKLKE
jgi:Tol biopolymer transport system component